MKDKQKDFSYTIGIYDIICREIRMKVQEEAEKEGTYGIGVYTDRYCEEELMTCPMKKTEERMQIARYFEGVDFVFSVDTKNPKQIEEEAKKAYLSYLEEQEKEEIKKYKIGFVIGSFDVFHAGHIENLELAKKMCDKLVAVLKTDERILQNKHKMPKQSTAERASILRMMKIIDDVLYMDLDTTRKDIIDDIKKLYEGTEPKDIVAIFGSDLQKKEEPFINKDWADINVIFTNRDSQKMKEVCSSNYQRMCDLNGGLENLEKRELENLNKGEDLWQDM